MNERLRDLTWQHRQDLEGIFTPIAKCTCLMLGPLDSDVVQRLKNEKRDQAPVLTSTGQVIGLLQTADAESLVAKGKPLATADHLISIATISSKPTLVDLLDTLLAKSAALVVDEDEGHRGEPWPVVGLVTVSDLNRHPFRTFLYEMLAVLEGSLARLVSDYCPDAWRWLEKLSEEKQARILGYWELSKRNDVDVGAVAGTTLTELLNIAAAVDDLRYLLRFAKRPDFEDKGHPTQIIELRNKVMHPVRPLIGKKEDMEKLKKALSGVFEIAERLRTINVADRWFFYRKTVFTVEGNGLGPSTGANGKLSRCFAVVTAHNPNGGVLSKETNEAGDKKLAECLDGSAYSRVRVTGWSSDFSHGEQGWAVVMPKDQAVALGITFGQQAIFWIDHDQLYLVPCLAKDHVEEKIGTWRKAVKEPGNCP